MKITEYDLRREAIWGLKNIAAFMACSTDRVRSMARDPTCPITRPGNQWFALKSELLAWMRSNPRKAA